MSGSRRAFSCRFMAVARASQACVAALACLASVRARRSRAGRRRTRAAARGDRGHRVAAAGGGERACRPASPCSTRRRCRPAGLQHFADVLGLVPNLNWSGGTSRPRYFQLRGIGELEQYQGAPNPSVGFLIDDIDFSGVGMPATTVRRRAGRGAARPAGHALRRQRARRADQGARRSDPTRRPELRDRSHGRRRRHCSARARRGRRAWPTGRRERSAWRRRRAALRAATASATTSTSAATTPTIATRRRCAASCGSGSADGWRVDVAALYVDLDNGFDAFSPDNSCARCRTSRAAMRSAPRGVDAARDGRPRAGARW